MKEQAHTIEFLRQVAVHDVTLLRRARYSKTDRQMSYIEPALTHTRGSADVTRLPSRRLPLQHRTAQEQTNLTCVPICIRWCPLARCGPSLDIG